MQTQMLYDSENYVVVHTDLSETGDNPTSQNPRNGFEIVCKQSNMSVFLEGSWALIFEKQINSWKANVPPQAEVEAILETYTALAQYPLIMH